VELFPDSLKSLPEIASLDPHMADKTLAVRSNGSGDC
jgi:hypothetical protein